MSNAIIINLSSDRYNHISPSLMKMIEGGWSKDHEDITIGYEDLPSFIKYILALKFGFQDIIDFIECLLPFKIDRSNEVNIEKYGIAIEAYIQFISKNLNKEDFLEYISCLISQCYILNGETYWYFHHKAHLLENVNFRSELACHYFSLAAYLSKDYELFHISNGCSSVRDINTVIESPIRSEYLDNDINFYVQHLDSLSHAVYVCCCDSKYFIEYADILLKSLIDSKVLAHIHLINPNEESMQLAKILSTKYSQFFINKIQSF